MPVIKITMETDLIFNEDRYFIRIDGKFIKGFGTEAEALDMANKLALNGGKEKSDEITLKEIIC